MAPQGAKKVRVAEIANKGMISLTLTAIMDRKILPLQAIYKEKTKQSLLKVNFPARFSLSTTIRYHINTQEVLKRLEEIVMSYVNAKRKKNGNDDQFAFLLWDVFVKRK